MKTKIILFSLLLAAQILPAQVSLQTRGSYAVVKLVSKHTVSGYLVAAGDTAIVIAVPIRGLKIDTTSILIIPIERIRTITIRDAKRNAVGGMGQGALIGFGVGALIGLAAAASQDSQGMIIISPGAAALGIGVAGAVLGTAIGAAVGGKASAKIFIDGNIHLYNQQRDQISGHTRAVLAKN